MFILYLLFVLIFATIVDALATPGESRRPGVFIGTVAVLLAASWAGNGRLGPLLFAEGDPVWAWASGLALAAGLFIVSAALTIRPPRMQRQAVRDRRSIIETEAAVFDLLLWGAFVTAGWAAMLAANH